MRFREIQLGEASVENIKVLQQLANAIWSSLPEVPDGSVKNVYLSQLPGFDRIYKVYQDHNKFAKAFRTMETTQLRVVNDNSYNDKHYAQKASVWGYYSARDDLLLVWSSNIKKHYAPGDVNGVRVAAVGVLIHELRHLFQYATYPKYYSSFKAYHAPYEQRPIEIDAVWSEILGGHVDVTQYRTQPIEFAAVVMDMLMNIKKLSEREVQHYAKKTLKYHRQFFDEDVEARWRQLLTAWGKRTQTDGYTVDNYVGDVMQDLDDYVQGQIKNPKTQQQVLDYYSQLTRKEFRRLRGSTGLERRKKSIIGQLVPVWNQIAAEFRPQFADHKISNTKIVGAINKKMEPIIRRAADNDELYKSLIVWFLRFTKEQVTTARE